RYEDINGAGYDQDESPKEELKIGKVSSRLETSIARNGWLSDNPFKARDQLREQRRMYHS
ncbi:MAG: hypothetical protein ABIJ08_07615, partial [Nanoarchaeota archaeon]